MTSRGGTAALRDSCGIKRLKAATRSSSTLAATAISIPLPDVDTIAVWLTISVLNYVIRPSPELQRACRTRSGAFAVFSSKARQDISAGDSALGRRGDDWNEYAALHQAQRWEA